MTISFTMTGREIVAKALRELGILDPAAEPEAAELTDALQTLNAMLKSWGGEGVTCWTDIEGSATITGADPDVVLLPRPLFVTQARVVISAENERLMQEWEQADYAKLPNKAAVGTPTIYSLRYTPTQTTMRVWPVPSTNMTVKYDYARTIEDATADAAVDVPQEWIECVYSNLAAKLAGPYGAADTNPGGVERVEARAAYLYAMMADASRPEYYELGPV